MEQKLIEEPNIPEYTDINFGMPIAPIDRLKIMNDVEFEELVAEWAHGYLKKDGISVYRLGGSGDKGRDICVKYKNGEIDIYQCKHYEKPLTKSEYAIELGKLIYYTWVEDGYEIPRNYYIVASNGLGVTLLDLINDSENLRQYIIDEWENKCEKKITKGKQIKLTGDLLQHLNNFDLSIIKYLSPQDLIEQYSKTIYFKFRFGGGIRKRPSSIIPEVTSNEEKLPFVRSLLDMYADIIKKPNLNLNSFLNDNTKYSKHFMREREAYYIADSLRRFLRDEYVNDNVFNKFENEVEKGVIDTFEDDYQSKFTRIKEVTKTARNLNILIPEIPEILPRDKAGTCHILVDKGVFDWNE
ncbi:TPA: restriction endonuclease [Enterococcus faecium]|uniref:ABC-three component system protein n=1 Tax=Enterococcus sp. DIV1371a TaxID=2774870 RepID=UPI003764D111|nr:restriction endonuclease [Enterococcus faecium]HCQ8930976.1 restriction endonuclease [Enterococcus faecium]